MTEKALEKEPAAAVPRVGDPISWVPDAWTTGFFPGAAKRLHGQIVYVNAGHGYYTAEAQFHGAPWRESFKYSAR